MYDDIFNIIKEEYDHLGPGILPREDQKRNIKKKILFEILSNSISGISHKELSKSLGVDRKTLRKYIKPLIQQKLVEREVGKHGKYYPSNQLHQHKDLKAYFFSAAYLNNFFIKHYMKGDLKDDLIIDSPYFKYNKTDFQKKLETEQGVGNALFNFSNKIGALITFLVIESMNPDNMSIPNISNQDIINYRLTKWLEDAISVFVPVLQPLFKDYIYNYLDCLLNKAIESRSPEDPDGLMASIDYSIKSPNILDRDCIDELHASYFQVYPNLQYPFMKINENFPNWLQKIEERSQKNFQKKEQQLKCSHNFVNSYNKFKDKKVLKCNKCEKLKYPY